MKIDIEEVKRKAEYYISDIAFKELQNRVRDIKWKENNSNFIASVTLDNDIVFDIEIEKKEINNPNTIKLIEEIVNKNLNNLIPEIARGKLWIEMRIKTIIGRYGVSIDQIEWDENAFSEFRVRINISGLTRIFSFSREDLEDIPGDKNVREEMNEYIEKQVTEWMDEIFTERKKLAFKLVQERLNYRKLKLIDHEWKKEVDGSVLLYLTLGSSLRIPIQFQYSDLVEMNNSPEITEKIKNNIFQSIESIRPEDPGKNWIQDKISDILSNLGSNAKMTGLRNTPDDFFEVSIVTKNNLKKTLRFSKQELREVVFDKTLQEKLEKDISILIEKVNAPEEYDIRNSIVRIFSTSKKNIIGTGFVISDELIISSNVIFNENQKLIEDIGKIYIDFPYVGKGIYYETKLIDFSILKENSNLPDFVLIQMKEALPRYSKPVPVYIKTDLLNEQVEIYGFPSFSPDGYLVRGELTTDLKDGRFILEANSFHKSFYGSPVWSFKERKVVGIALGMGLGKNAFTVESLNSLFSRNKINLGLDNDIDESNNEDVKNTRVEIKDERQDTLEPTKNVSVGGLEGAVNDRIPEEDQLGFDCYVKTFADLIESKHTNPPLTIGVFGRWGMGKTFILDHIEKELEKRKKGRQKASQQGFFKCILQYGELILNKLSALTGFQTKKGNEQVADVHTIKFNAWEYNSMESIWPGLIRKVMDGMENSVFNFLGKIKFKFSKFFRKIWKKDKITIIIFFLLLATMVFGFYGGYSNNNFLDFSIFLSSLSVISILLFGFITEISKVLSSPLSSWLINRYKECDYGKRIQFMDEIKEDMEELEKKLKAKNSRLLIIVDDLDRCEPKKVMEVLQALKLMLDFESFVFCIGIDARIISREIETYYEGMLGPKGISGYEYLEKIIQIPFWIPVPTTGEVNTFLHKQMNVKKKIGIDSEKNGEKVSEKEKNIEEEHKKNGAMEKFTAKTDITDMKKDETEKDTEIKEKQPIKTQQKKDEKEEVEINKDSAFEEYELNEFKILSEFIRPNPRHVKRVLNIYRFIKSLAKRKKDENFPKNPQNVIRWVLLCCQWPYSLHKILHEYDNNGKGKTEAFKKNLFYDFYEETYSNKKLDKNKQRLFDYSEKKLEKYLEYFLNDYTDKEIEILRKYTINFNQLAGLEFLSESIPDDNVTEPIQSSRTPSIR